MQTIVNIIIMASGEAYYNAEKGGEERGDFDLDAGDDSDHLVLLEHVALIVKPGAPSRRSEEVRAHIHDAGLVVCRETSRTFDEEEIRGLYELGEGGASLAAHEEAAVKYMTSGKCVCFEIAGRDALARMQSLVGPSRVAKARKLSPKCLTARFGTSDIRNGVSLFNEERAFCTLFKFYDPPSLFQLTLRGAEEDMLTINEEKSHGRIRLNSPLRAQRFVEEIYTPSVKECLRSMCIRGNVPPDPWEYLANWILKSNPLNEIKRRKETAISKMAARVEVEATQPWKYPVFTTRTHLMSEEYEGIHNATIFGNERMFPAVWNFRESEGRAPIFGCGLPHQEGAESVLKALSSDGGYKGILWINARQSPSVYLQGELITLKEKGTNAPRQSPWEGLPAQSLEQIEERFKRDVAHHAVNHAGAVAVMFRDASMASSVKMFKGVASEIKVHEDGSVECSHFQGLSSSSAREGGRIPQCGVRTPADLFKELVAAAKGAYNLQYNRLPMCPNEGFTPRDFDLMLSAFHAACADSTTAYICCCVDGMKRTSALMSMLSIYWNARWGSLPSKNPIAAAEGKESDFAYGNFKCINTLINALGPDGERIKWLVDACVDECGVAYSLRRSIPETISLCERLKGVEKKGNARSDGTLTSAAACLDAHAHLRRYYMAIVFAGYVVDQAGIEQQSKLSGPSEQFVFGAHPTFEEWFNDPERILVKRGMSRCSLE